MRADQLPLFPGVEAKGQFVSLPLDVRALDGKSSLAAAMGAFHEHMVRQGFSPNTIKAFSGDLRLLAKFLGQNKAIGEIGTQDLVDFLTYLRFYRGVPCAPKSYARRVTTLKVLFGWLSKEKVIAADPAAALVHEPASSPLPEVLYDDQVERLLQTTKKIMERAEKPDPRPHLLVTLLLHTGLKKSECLGIRLSHLDLSSPQNPALYVRYEDPRKRKKERVLQLPPNFPSLFGRYQERYAPKERLFECTARNLEYVLADAAREAGLAQGVSFENLRMTAALRDYRAGVPADRLREKLGLSAVSWREREAKLKRLASRL
ncbi:MAG: tyrosine-type recombinase/integrase [Chloroflexi bacterium]|nr:tyrosine-type recombinase/integrase [Chloroflexota bacterium]